jgi:hypothetical protein
MMRIALAGESPSARDRAEFERMIGEKLMAFHEAWFAMYWATVRAGLQFSSSMLQAMMFPWGAGPWAARVPSRATAASGAALQAAWQKAAAEIAGAGLAPIRRRAVGNARRLGRSTGAARR